MVKNREALETTLHTKIVKLLKRLPCRGYLKVSEAVNFYAEDGSKLLIVSDPNGQVVASAVYRCPESEDDIRKIIQNLLKAIPLRFLEFKVTDVQKTLQTLNYSFSFKGIPDDFIVFKLPKRQLAIRTSDKIVFIDICSATYQKILAVVDSAKDWLEERSFSSFAKCMKRKELGVLLLSIRQLVD